jgi:hypothetical protein
MFLDPIHFFVDKLAVCVEFDLAAIVFACAAIAIQLYVFIFSSVSASMSRLVFVSFFPFSFFFWSCFTQ